MAKQKQQTRKVFQAVRWTALGQYGTYNGGENITTDRVPESTLKELEGQGMVTYVGTEVWDEATNAWVAKEASEQPAHESDAQPEPKDEQAVDAPKGEAGGQAEDKADKPAKGGK